MGGAGKPDSSTWLDYGTQQVRDMPWWAKVGVGGLLPPVGAAIAANDLAGLVNDKVIKPVGQQMQAPTKPPDLPASVAPPPDLTSGTDAAQMMRKRVTSRYGIGNTFSGAAPSSILGGQKSLLGS